MRREDREILDPERIAAIIAECTCCRIGFIDGGVVYIVPMNFGYECSDDGMYTLYFHGAKEGRKIDLTSSCPRVGFEMDTGYALRTAQSACRYSATFRSIVGTGIVSLVDGAEEKQHGLELLMRHVTGKAGWIWKEKMIRSVAVIRLKVQSMSCKESL